MVDYTTQQLLQPNLTNIEQHTLHQRLYHVYTIYPIIHHKIVLTKTKQNHQETTTLTLSNHAH